MKSHVYALIVAGIPTATKMYSPIIKSTTILNHVAFQYDSAHETFTCNKNQEETGQNFTWEGIQS